MSDDPKCVAGCVRFYGGEKRHHKDCPYYPESLTKLNADRIEELEAKLAELQDVRRWYHYPIEMPLSADGQGPATIGTDARKITYEVWDVLLHTHASFDNLPDAINEAMRLNATLAELTGGKDE